MHTLGKVLAFLCVGLAVAALVLSTRALQARNSWIKSVETKRAAYVKVAKELGPLEQKLADRKEEYRRLMYLWSPFIADNVTVQPRGKNSVLLSVGPAQGVRSGQTLHIFEATADGGSIYVGPFKVGSSDPAGSDAVAAWPLRGTDADRDWPPPPFRLSGPGYRVYGSVPNSAQNNLVHYAQLLVRKDLQTFSANSLLQARDRQIQIANEHLVYRNNELHGDPGLENDRGLLPDFMIDGYVKAIEDADERRNALALQVDDLRHSVKRTYDEVQRLQTRNVELMNSLAPYEEPGTAPAVGD